MNPERPFTSGVEAEPQVGAAEVPIIFFGILAGLMFVGFLYLDKYAGGFDNMVYRPFESHKQVDLLQPQDPDAKMAAAGLRVFDNACKICHQPNGLGTPGQFPPLDGSEWVNGPVIRLARIPMHGLAGPISIKGEAWNAAMPAIGAALNDEELAALLTYVRRAWSNKSGPVTPEQIKKIRAAEAARTQPWSSAELLKFNDPAPTAK